MALFTEKIQQKAGQSGMGMDNSRHGLLQCGPQRQRVKQGRQANELESESKNRAFAFNPLPKARFKRRPQNLLRAFFVFATTHERQPAALVGHAGEFLGQIAGHDQKQAQSQ